VNICIPIYVGIATAYGAQVALEMAMVHRIESDLHVEDVHDECLG
jgi:hypothetical protein